MVWVQHLDLAEESLIPEPLIVIACLLVTLDADRCQLKRPVERPLEVGASSIKRRQLGVRPIELSCKSGLTFPSYVIRHAAGGDLVGPDVTLTLETIDLSS
jgi:hypothetical protein